MRNSKSIRTTGRLALTAGAAVSLLSTTVFAQTVDVSQWSPEYVQSIAGTEDYDTAGHCV